jgi:uncharacterized protein YjeT (DUF2065 family)
VENFWIEIGRAFALMLVIEGILPFAYPQKWRTMLRSIAENQDRLIRTVGFGSMITGLFILYLL